MDKKQKKRCQAEGCIRLGGFEPMTHRCQLDEGHELPHEFKKNARTITWYGEARKVDHDQRYRFGAWIESQK